MNPDKEHENMRLWLRFSILAMFVIVAMCFMASSCCVCKPRPEQINYRDSTIVHIKDSVSVRDSVVYVQLPVEGSQNILPETRHSKLETSLAESEAWVDSLGLHHTLENKTKPIEVHVPVTEHHTEVSSDHQEATTHTITKEVERELTWWQKVKMEGFWFLLVGLILAVFAIIKLIKK